MRFLITASIGKHIRRDEIRREEHVGKLPSPHRLSILHRLHLWLCTHRPFSRLSLLIFPSIRIEVCGIKFLAWPGRKNYTEESIWRLGDLPERESIEALLKYTQKKSTFIDIGANIGLFGISLAKDSSPDSRVICFEPNPEIACRLRKNVSLNRLGCSLEVVEGAVGGVEQGQALLNISIKNAGESSVRSLGSIGNTIKVPIYPLSEIIASVPVDARCVIKCDVEGYECEVFLPILEGAAHRLPDVILIETEHRDIWAVDLIERFIGAGYVKTFEGDGNCLLVKEMLSK